MKQEDPLLLPEMIDEDEDPNTGEDDQDDEEDEPEDDEEPPPREEEEEEEEDPPGFDAGADADDGGASPAGDAEGPPQPIALPDPAEPGPFEVAVEENVGDGFENAINENDMPGNNAYCEDFVQSFGQDPEQAMEFAKIPPGLNMALYTLYRPTNFEPGKTYPVLTWGNGTCALPSGYQYLLKHVASHGFIVIAAHSRFVGDGRALLKGVDFVLAASVDSGSPLFGKVDGERIGAFGHSQGSLGASAAGQDERIDTTGLLNGFGGNLRTPTFLLTGEQDLAPLLSQLAFSGASVPAAFINFKNSDHITLITEPQRVYPSVTAWFRYQLRDDPAGKAYFVGSSCALCNHDDEWTFEQKELN